MKAAVFYAPSKLKIEDRPVPSAEAGEILVRNHVTLTCGTDLKIYKRGHPLARPPLIIGHEFAGVIEKLGKDVERFKIGDRIVAANSAPCNSCENCRRGRYSLCARLEECIIGFSYPGAYAEYLKIPSHIVKKNTHLIPSNLSFEEAAFLEPLSCVVHGQNRVEIDPGDEVLVMGAGPIGLLHAQLARKHAAGRVIVSDPHQAKLDGARKLGADVQLLGRGEEVEKQVREITGGRGPEVVIESVGTPEAWESATRMVSEGGTVLFFGGCPSGTAVSLDTGKIHYGELKLVGAFHHTPKDVEVALRLIASGAVQVRPMITKRMPLLQVEEALQSMGRGESIKVATIPDV